MAVAAPPVGIIRGSSRIGRKPVQDLGIGQPAEISYPEGFSARCQGQYLPRQGCAATGAC